MALHLSPYNRILDIEVVKTQVIYYILKVSIICLCLHNALHSSAITSFLNEQKLLMSAHFANLYILK